MTPSHPNSRSFSRRAVLGAGAGALGTGALALAGCDSAQGSTSGTGTKKTTLVVAQWTNPPAISFTKWFNAKFEKAHPSVKVKVQDAPTAKGAYKTLQNTLLQGKAVDIIAYSAMRPTAFPPSFTGLKPKGVASLIAADQMTDLTDQPFMKNYDKAQQLTGCGYEGKIYGVWSAAYDWASPMWYKKDILAKYDLGIPNTFDEFIATCTTLKSHGVTPVFFYGGNTELWYGLAWQIMMKGHSSKDSTKLSLQMAKDFWTGKTNWTSEPWVEATNKYEQIASQFIEQGAGGVHQLAAPGVWAAKSDDYAFLVDGSWDSQTIKTANPNLNFGFFTTPGTNNPKDHRPMYWPDLSWFVPTWAKNKSLALEWLEMFSEPENYQKWLQETGSFSMQPSLKPKGVKWMDWLNSHSDDAFISPPRFPYLPAGAPKEAKTPPLADMVPFGKLSADAGLAQAAKAYTKAVKSAK